jgi:flagellar motor switch protein FliN
VTDEPDIREEQTADGEQLAAPEPEPPTASSEPPTGGGPSADLEPEILDEMPDPAVDLAAHMLDVNVRLWAELGRARLPLAEAVALGTGAIVDLDKEPDETLDVFVNGTPFARATLLLVDGEWAVRLEEILASPEAVEHASSSGSEA